MKVLGTIQPEFNEDNECINSEYVDGKIIAFSSKETYILSLLQKASEGHEWDWGKFTRTELEDKSVSDALWCVHSFVVAKFKINEFQNVIDELNNMLMTNAGGGYKEFPGLDNQITTGKVDANTGTACASLDSDVI